MLYCTAIHEEKEQINTIFEGYIDMGYICHDIMLLLYEYDCAVAK